MEKEKRNKFNKLWKIECFTSRTAARAEKILEDMNAIFAKDGPQTGSSNYIYYVIGTQHRFMNICKSLGAVKLTTNGCVLLDDPEGLDE